MHLHRGRKEKNPGKGLVSRWNILMAAVQVLFILLHLVQTHIWYDGLAKDVPIWTSQGSVIVMLVLILYLMIPVRGLFWGRTFRPPQKMLSLLRRWHGPYIMWALIYTFWFHPMDGNWGLTSGFIYMYMLFLQLTLFRTSIHFNKYWIVLLEAFVAVHGTLITVYKHNEIWPMFLFGFLVMFFLTQLYTWKMKSLWKWLSLAGFAVSILLVYGLVRGFDHIYEVSFIPAALYGGVLALLLIGYIWDKVTERKGKS